MPELEHGADESIPEEGSGRLSWGVGHRSLGQEDCHRDSLQTVRGSCVLIGNFSSDLLTPSSRPAQTGCSCWDDFAYLHFDVC